MSTIKVPIQSNQSVAGAGWGGHIAARRDVEFQVGQSVLLSTKYLRRRMCLGSKAIAPKLMPRYIGPYKVLRKVGSLACHLDLEGLACHPVFHVSLLREYKSSGSYQPPMPYVLDGDIVFDVERILDRRFEKRGRAAPKLQYLMNWEGYSAEHDNWEPEVNLRDAPEPLALYAECKRADAHSTQEDSGAVAASEKQITPRACADAFWQQPEAERHSVWREASLI